MSEPLVINGFRFCRRCVAKVGGPVAAWTHPGIFNAHSNVKHLNRDARPSSLSKTLCGLDTRKESWEEPWREHERQQEIRWRRWDRERKREEELLNAHRH